MNTDCRLSFPEWILQIESQLDTVERFYVDHTGLFDAMPAVWKNMSTDMRTQLFNVIKELYDEALQADEEPWPVKNILKFIPFVPFNKILKIRGYFLFALDHPSVFLDPA